MSLFTAAYRGQGLFTARGKDVWRASPSAPGTRSGSAARQPSHRAARLKQPASLSPASLRRTAPPPLSPGQRTGQVARVRLRHLVGRHVGAVNLHEVRPRSGWRWAGLEAAARAGGRRRGREGGGEGGARGTSILRKSSRRARESSSADSCVVGRSSDMYTTASLDGSCRKMNSVTCAAAEGGRDEAPSSRLKAEEGARRAPSEAAPPCTPRRTCRCGRAS